MNANISIFVPHLGCKYKCSFCNQFTITDIQNAPTINDVDEIVSTGISSMPKGTQDVEIAFFGGSFTAIDIDYMQMLLQTAYKYVKSGLVKGIRISTRPDEIDCNRLEILKSYGVTSIELGAQSMNDDVLAFNHRGHCVQGVIDACKLIREYDFELGLQMMTGLYKSNDRIDIDTAKAIIDLKPDTVRVYPTLILKNTYLYKLYCDGKYRPQELEQAVELCSEILPMFRENDIIVIRTGLHTINEEELVDGPWHPAFGELCESRIYRNKLENELKSDSIIYCNKSDVSKIIGQKKQNINYFKSNGINIKVVVDNDIKKGSYKIEEANSI